MKPFIYTARNKLYIIDLKKTKNKLEESEFLLSQSQKVANIGSYVFDIKSGIWQSTAFLDEIFGNEFKSSPIRAEVIYGNQTGRNRR